MPIPPSRFHDDTKVIFSPSLSIYPNRRLSLATFYLLTAIRAFAGGGPLGRTSSFPKFPRDCGSGFMAPSLISHSHPAPTIEPTTFVQGTSDPSPFRCAIPGGRKGIRTYKSTQLHPLARAVLWSAYAHWKPAPSRYLFALLVGGRSGVDQELNLRKRCERQAFTKEVLQSLESTQNILFLRAGEQRLP